MENFAHPSHIFMFRCSAPSCIFFRRHPQWGLIFFRGGPFLCFVSIPPTPYDPKWNSPKFPNPSLCHFPIILSTENFIGDDTCLGCFAGWTIIGGWTE